MLFLLEEIEERLADIFGSHLGAQFRRKGEKERNLGPDANATLAILPGRTTAKPENTVYPC